MRARVNQMQRLLCAFLLVTLAACAERRVPTRLPPDAASVEEGVASWYGLEERGRRTASGETMDPERLTAAHPAHPFGTVLQITDLDTQRSVQVVVNDRGPFVRGRVVDLSYGAARELGIVEKGLARVRVRVDGVDRSRLMTRWVVQAGSFSLEAAAQALARRLLTSGFTPLVVSPWIDAGTTFYRVHVGRFTERAQAEQLAERLRANGHEVLVAQTEIITRP
jgi:rare lipoprotein A